MKILEIRDEQIIAEVNGEVCVRPNSPYYMLKYHDYDNRRIGYMFGSGSYVMETYDDRIFNAVHDGQRLQFRQDLSDLLADAINQHKQNGTDAPYRDLFGFALREYPDMDILTYYLGDIDGVEYSNKRWIINKMFSVDTHGNAYTWRNGRWKSLCLVRNDQPHDFYPILDANGNTVNINNITMTILAKVLFMINPNTKDSVFMSQLEESVQILVSETNRR